MERRHLVAEQVFVEAPFEDVVVRLAHYEPWCRPLVALAVREAVAVTPSEWPMPPRAATLTLGPPVEIDPGSAVEVLLHWVPAGPAFNRLEGLLYVWRHAHGAVLALEGICYTADGHDPDRLATRLPWEAAARSLLGGVRSVIEHAAA